MKKVIFLSFFFLFSLKLNSLAQFYELWSVHGSKDSGLRFGVTYLGKEYSYSYLSYVKKNNSGHYVSQIGVQKDFLISARSEKKFYFRSMFLLSGLEQSLIFPSLTGIIGAKNLEGKQYGFGVNTSFAGLYFIVYAGKTFEWGNSEIPLDLFFGVTRDRISISLLSGILLNNYSKY